MGSEVPHLLGKLARSGRVSCSPVNTLVSSAHGMPIAACVLHNRNNSRRAGLHRRPHRSGLEWTSLPINKRRERAKLLLTHPPMRDVEQPAENRQVVLLSSTRSREREAAALLAQSDPAIISIPISLAYLACFIRRREEVKCSSSGPGFYLAPPSLPRLEPGTAGCEHALLEDYVRVFCAPQSKDLVVLELKEGTMDGDEPLSQQVIDALSVGANMLKDNGALLVTAPSSSVFRSRDVQKFTKWRFMDTASGKLHTSLSYLFCASLTTEHAVRAVSALEKFPGLLPKGIKRDKSWNPYRGRSQSHTFVASLRPSFTNAAYTRDALQADLERQKVERESMMKDDDAFFSVSHEMVETQAHYAKRDD